ncbi:hypothetical protein ABB37_02976 [Leptomonas pyrrhocoris]|uniref:Guanine nucleotide-binding protein subunit beta-like protein n=1 Tax=Leptomonas pyrrhocoris TaxID=157538 RepID=A0A0N0DXS2_LEPPY|nr:hypothetical protein ABB37_02976 [Leptomonas pyrrhocoris]KPA83315.1 hypothetical protein ABB37_02976 [Leptomonas pyrrhocoris]|eukprot:XP_015661754.1 hypothetical protein ABB37_02976 [Leptomonas pyrrhocoris]
MLDTREPPSKTACRLEVLGKVSSIHYDCTTASCLVSTILNGAHVFNLDDNFYGANLAVGLSSSSVESYPYHDIGEAPLLSSSFFSAGQLFAVGSSSGTVTVVSRRSRAMTSCYSTPDGLPIRSVHEVVSQPNCLLTCTQRGAEVIDVERSQLRTTLENPAPGRAVAAVPLSPHTFVVANYDGKVLLYDTRYRHTPSCILSIPDQITCVSAALDTAEVCVGTVGGRVFTLRCTEGPQREQAFGMSTRRSPVRCVSMDRGRIAAGDLAGRLALIDTADVPDPTVYWSAETLLRASRQSPVDCLDSCDDGAGTHARSSPSTAAAFADSEVTAVTLAQGTVWMSFGSPKSTASQIVAIPA